MAKLEELVKPERVQMATVDIVDIAGLVKGASKGEGLGNQFLGNIRECNAIIHVLRCFDNDNIVHVDGNVNPIRDKETIDIELQLKDLENVEKRLEKVNRAAKTGNKEAHHIILEYYSKQYLSFGLSYNINNFKIDISKFNATHEIPIIDPSITDNRSISNNNFDVGLLYRNKGFYVSFNASNILPKTKDNYLGIEPSLVLNYQLYSGYVIKNSHNRNVEIEPSVYYQFFAGDKRSTTDLNLKYRHYNSYDDYYWAGVSYRFLNDQSFKPLTVGPMAGFKKANFYFGYSYQVTLNQIAAYNSGTHMVTLGFNFLQGISDCPCTQSPLHD